MSGNDSITAECDVPFACDFGPLQSTLALVGATFFTLFSVALHSCFEGTASFWSRSCTSDALVPSEDLTTLLPDSCFMSLHCGFEGRPIAVDFCVESTTLDDFTGLVWALVNLASMA